jgi:D-alanyl-D-alanine carboxypeptidase
MTHLLTADVFGIRPISVLAFARSRFRHCVSLLLVLFGLTAGNAYAADPPYAATLRTKLLKQLQTDQCPGAVVYVNDPNLGIWKAALGSADLSGTPMDIDSHMRIGSVTKTLTATAVLIAVDKNLIKLDESISSQLPHVVPRGHRISIRSLLNMTAGLFNNTEDDAFNVALDVNPFRAYTVRETLDIAFRHPPYFTPGLRCDKRNADLNQPPCWHYSNTNYLVLGLLLEKVTGMKVEDIFQRWIFTPLGMNHSVMPPIASAAIPAPHPRGYLFGTNVQSNEAYKAAIAGNAEGSKIVVPPGVPPTDATDWNPSYTWTAGSAISTVSDMAIWAKALATGALLKPETHRQQLKWAPRITYGLGIAEALPGFLGHDGAVPGFQSLVAYSLDSGAEIIVLTNSEIVPNTPLEDALPANNLATIIDKALFRQEWEPK